MSQIDRKAALAQYRDRKPQAGIYALRCTATGACWLGATPTLGTVENRQRFTLTQGSHPNAALQKAARSHGVDALVFQILEALPTDTPAVARERLLDDRLAWHLDRLGASRL